MLKLFENRFINTMNKLAVSVEDIKDQVRGNRDTQLMGTCLEADKDRLHGHNGMEPASSKMASDVFLKTMTHDIVFVITEQHNRLMLALEAQTQKLEAQTQRLDKLEQVCLHRTRSDEPRFDEPSFEEVLQTVGDLKVRLGKIRRKVVLFSRNLSLQRNMSADGIATPLFGPYNPRERARAALSVSPHTFHQSLPRNDVVHVRYGADEQPYRGARGRQRHGETARFELPTSSAGLQNETGPADELTIMSD
jgi:hypothetical protein